MKKALFSFCFLFVFEAFTEDVSHSDILLSDKEFAEHEAQKAQQMVAEMDGQLEPSSEHIEFAKEISEHQKVNLEDFYQVAKKVKYLTGALPAMGEGCKDCGSSVLVQSQESIDTHNSRSGDETLVSESSVTLVFVSFSMPKASLIELSNDSLKYNATLVLRGIHKESFLKTKDKILEINPNGLHLDINPELFKQYDIKRVPTFVFVRNGKEVSRLSGNVTLEYAVSKFKEAE